MTFQGKRLSRDRQVIGDIVRTVGDQRLLLNRYSATLFPDGSADLTVREDFLDAAERQDWCFVENRSINPYSEKVDALILYRWNRRYPFDRALDFDPAENGLTLREVTEFVGYSHEKITKEIYEK